MGFIDRLLGKDVPPQHLDAEAPGWDAIMAACRAVYPDQVDPLHMGTIIRYALGGPDPIDGVDIYRAARPVAHWHYVTYGFSDLYDTEPPEAGEGDEAPLSGYGFELTFRLADPHAADPGAKPPVWPINLLQNLARYVFGTGNGFAAGHHMDANGPIALEAETALEALLFVADPDLGSIDTPRGTVRFVQVVGITRDELEAIVSWDAAQVALLIEARHPRWVTDLARASILDDPAARDAVDEGRRSDGSSQAVLYAPGIGLDGEGDERVLRMSQVVARSLAAALPLRLPYGKPLVLLGGDHGVLFVPGERSGWTVDDDGVEVSLSADSLAALDPLAVVVPGDHQVPGLDGLVWRVEPAAD